nr:probable serine/threonine-protein kinase DDB_G0272254 isoform X2 [Ipomoea batatas]GME06227.1 probable serine/threonine-protein kinase DDB_G0272254 isoform X2 [Ipomoea batatas]GME20160.1 probable serine/threonine-protein kinase DDB_G0272254 isoform X2 [Ipomoea batatas]GME20161.1 probable serine/threonine-protein kinase DDB_G0272254 isoform X2 [Ipomoea batatas]
MENTTASAEPPSQIPPAEELLKKIHELEAGHERLKEEMSKLMVSNDYRSERQRSHSISPQRPRRVKLGGGGRHGGFEGGAMAVWKRGSASFRHSSPLQRESSSKDVYRGDDGGGGESCGVGGPTSVKFSDRHYLNILQSMGQSVHILDRSSRIIYWNRMAEHLYGYSAAEALGQSIMDLLVDPRDFNMAGDIISRVCVGESWTGQFPVKNKLGIRFSVMTTNTPFYDDDGTLIGLICVSVDVRPFQESKAAFTAAKQMDSDSSSSRARSIASEKLGLDPQQPLQVAIASKLSNLASKVSNKVKSKIKTVESGVVREGGSGDSHQSNHVFSDSALSDHREDATSSGASTPRGDIPPSPFGVFSNASKEDSPEKYSRDSGDESEGKPRISKIITSKAEAWIQKRTLSWPWKGNEQEGSEARNTRFGWPWLHNDQDNDYSQPQNSSNLAIKPESQMGEINRTTVNEASGSWSSSFNVNSTSSASSAGSTSSSALNKVDTDTDCLDYEILWEDLTIGEHIGQGIEISFLQDVAVKVFSKQEYSDDIIFSFRQEVGDFGLSRVKHETYLTTKTDVDMMSCLYGCRADVYSFGVILWEIATEKIPWENLNTMQVIGAVGFMNQRLDIPKDVDPQWASIIGSCWHSEPQCRPSFQELVDKFKDLQRQCAIQIQAARNAAMESSQKE